MTSEEQKRIWKKEKEQMLHDKQKAGKEVRYRKATLKMGGMKKHKPHKPADEKHLDVPPDDVLRRQLGI
ncbi:MAG: hypothetical protein ABIH39_05055 [Candidatus Margulisiibacteriota bacterium]